MKNARGYVRGYDVRTGKRLSRKLTEVAIQFKDVPQVLFNQNPEVPLEPTVPDSHSCPKSRA
jgi:hypothetical protein